MTDARQDAPGEPASLTDRVRAQQVRMLFANNGLPLIATLVTGGIVSALLVRAGTLSLRVAIVWMACMVTHTVARLLVRVSYFRARPADTDWRLWARRGMAGVVAGALTWGIGVFWLMAPGRLDLQMFVAAVLMAASYGAMNAFSCYLPAFYAFFPVVFGAVILWFCLQGDAIHWACAVMFAFWMPTVAVLAKRYNAALTQALELQYANDALVRDLTAQKAFAEQASLAKSRFLASASHDLRQPVHALGMFVGALRSHSLPQRSVALIDHIDASLGGLDSLFTSLLDISKLDAGVVQGEVSSVSLRPLLERVASDLKGEADAKGIALRVMPTRLAVESDPVLLERIVRNLVGNAVRYTETGGVAVDGARRAAGKVSVEVWDTGPGIAPEHREAVFEEFYQLANPDRDRTKGLGLGLPIVRRLAAILGHEIALESRPGKGSVFRVRAPRAVPAPLKPEPRTAAPAASQPAAGLILAIDDEQAVRAGMAELLQSWGHRVVAVAGGDEAKAALTEAPDLIICDYRLRGGADGIAAIRELQSHFGSAIPAILVTGDTAADRIREAQASGYPLLHKPLAHARLRAAVTTLLRRP